MNIEEKGNYEIWKTEKKMKLKATWIWQKRRYTVYQNGLMWRETIQYEMMKKKILFF